MDIGFQSSRYDGLSLFQELKFACENNVDFFDVFFDGFMPFDISEEEVLLIKKMKKEGFNFTVHLPIGIDKCSECDLLSLSEFVAELKPVTATVHFDKLSWEFLEKLIALFSKNTKFCIENTIPDNNPNYNSCYFDFMKKASEKYDIYSTFDTGHCNVNMTSENKTYSGNIADYAESLLKNGIKIATVHNHDNDGTKDAHNFIGSGNINFEDFYDVLKKYNQNPMLVIEHWTDNIKTLESLRNFN